MISRHALLLAVLSASFGLFLSPDDAFAHAEYESSTPARDEVVQQPPAQVDVTFTQEVSRQDDRSSVRVFNEANTQVSEGIGVIDDADRTHMSATLQPNLPAGRYIVRYTTLSDEDGDDFEGAVCFYVQTPPTAAQQAECAAFGEPEEPTATAATATSAEPGATPTSVDSGNDDDGGNSGAVAGVIVGVVIAVAVVAGGLFLWMRRSRA